MITNVQQLGIKMVFLSCDLIGMKYMQKSHQIYDF